MPLKSVLFSGDAALEACAISDSAHLTLGTPGPHVGKVHKALMTLGAGVVAADEIAHMRYGTTTASTVLAFKTKRGIINPAYQSKPDNIVGKMTISAIDREIADFEAASGRCPSCVFERGTRNLVVAFDPSDPTSLPLWLQSPRLVALTLVGSARMWNALAIAWLDYLIGVTAEKLGTGSARSRNFDGADPEAAAAARTHFKADKAADTLAQLRRVRGVFALVSHVLANADGFFGEDLLDPANFAYAFPGSLFWPVNDQRRRLFFCRRFISNDGLFPNGPLFRTAVIVHEAAHFVDQQVGHSASELPADDGSPVTTTGNVSGHNYAQMTSQEAFQNAYSYAQFALHAFMGRDYRLTPFLE